LFNKQFPSRTAGDGSPFLFSTNRGEGQGESHPGFDVKCKQCGFPVDIDVTDHKGGTPECVGGYGAITVDGDGIGQHDVRKGAGCPLCGTKNII